MRIVTTVLLVAGMAPLSASADTVTTINFETVPALSPGASFFTDAGPPQTINVPGVAQVSGGVVLDVSDSPFTSGIPFITPPNILATASNNVIGNGGFGLPDTITINTPSGVTASAAVIPVLNGMVVPETYVVTGWDGSATVALDILSNVPALQNSGYGVANLTALAMTSITIAPLDVSAWDFATDTIQLTEGASTIQQSPEPSSAALWLSGLAVMTFFARRFLRAAAPRV